MPVGESVVFGQVRTDTKIPQGNFWTGDFSYVSVMDVQRSLPVLRTPPIEDRGGLFCWHLPPGKYAIYELGRTRTPGSGVQFLSRNHAVEKGPPIGN